MCTVTRSTDRGNRSFFILFRDKKRPLLKLQGPGTSKLPWKPDSLYPSLLKSIWGVSVERPYPGHTNSVWAPWPAKTTAAKICILLVTNYVCFGIISEAENDLQNWVSDDLVVGVHSSSVYHPTVSSPTDRYCDNDVQNNVTWLYFCTASPTC